MAKKKNTFIERMENGYNNDIIDKQTLIGL